MKTIIKLTDYKGETILIGVRSIIEVKSTYLDSVKKNVSMILSRGAMVETNYVLESIDEIYSIINN